MADPILIAACPRSGATMTAGILYHCGAWGGSMGIPHRHNSCRIGDFENIPIRNVLHDLARAMKVDPRGQKPLPRAEDFAKLDAEEWWERITTAAVADGYTEGPWFIKHPLIASAYPFWCAMFPDSQWVVVRRAVENVVFSCLHTSYMDAYRNDEDWEKWAQQYERILRQIESMDRALEVWPSRFIHGNTTEIEGVVKGLGLTWTPRCLSLIETEQLTV